VTARRLGLRRHLGFQTNRMRNQGPEQHKGL
jgi:hypothetical protein